MTGKRGDHASACTCSQSYPRSCAPLTYAVEVNVKASVMKPRRAVDQAFLVVDQPLAPSSPVGCSPIEWLRCFSIGAVDECLVPDSWTESVSPDMVLLDRSAKRGQRRRLFVSPRTHTGSTSKRALLSSCSRRQHRLSIGCTRRPAMKSARHCEALDRDTRPEGRSARLGSAGRG